MRHTVLASRRFLPRASRGSNRTSARFSIAIRIRRRASANISSSSHSSADARRNNLLRQHIEWGFRNHQAVEISRLDRPHQRRTFHQIVARSSKESSLRNRARASGRSVQSLCSATAIDRGELICTAKSTDPTSIPSSSDAVATRTLIWPSLSFFSAASRNLRDRLP